MENINDENNKMYLFGLPTNLLKKEGKKISIISFMQNNAGLNREKRRDLQSHVKKVNPIPYPFNIELTNDEVAVIAPFITQNFRFDLFWWMVEVLYNKKQYLGTKKYALNIIYHLINSYDKNWVDNKFIEKDFLKICPEWLEIKTNLEQKIEKLNIKIENESDKYSFLTIWKKIKADINKWEKLNQLSRENTINAIFSLSSATYSDFFIKYASDNCEDLNREFNNILNFEAITKNRAEEKKKLLEEGNIDSKIKINEVLLRLQKEINIYLNSANKENYLTITKIIEEIINIKPDFINNDYKLNYKNKLNKLFDIISKFNIELNIAWIDVDIYEENKNKLESIINNSKNENEINRLKNIDEISNNILLLLENYNFKYSDYKIENNKIDEINLIDIKNLTALELRKIQKDKNTINKKIINIEEEIQNIQDEVINLLIILADGNENEESESIINHKFENEEKNKIEVNEIKEDGIKNSKVLLNQIPPIKITENKVIIDNEENNSIKTIDIKTNNSDDIFDKKNQNNIVQVDHFTRDNGIKSKPIWECLYLNRLALSFQYIQNLKANNDNLLIPSNNLIACILLSGKLYSQNSIVKNELSIHLNNILEDEFINKGSKSYTAAVNLLLIAATLRSMIITPEIGSATIAGYHHLDSNRYEKLYSLVNKFINFSELLQGFTIDTTTLNLTKTEIDFKNNYKNLINDANEWLNNYAGTILIKYAPAAKVWANWYRKGGRLYTLLKIVIDDNLSEINNVKKIIQELEDINSFTKLVTYTDRVELNRKRGDDIFPLPLDQLKKNTDIAINFAKKWVAYNESESNTSTRLTSLLNQVRDYLNDSFEAVEIELLQDTIDDNWSLVKSSQNVLLQELSNIKSLFDTNNNSLTQNELPIKLIYNGELLLFKEITLDENYEIITNGINLIDIFNKYTIKDLSWSDAINEKISIGDFFAADLIHKFYDNNFEFEYLNDLRRDSESWRNRLYSLVKKSKNEVEVGSAYGYLDEDTRNNFESNLNFIESKIDLTLQFNILFLQVETIRTLCNRKRDEQIGLKTKELNDVSNITTNKDDLNEIKKAINLGDIATANEYLQRLKDGHSIWPENLSSQDYLYSYNLMYESICDYYIKNKTRDLFIKDIKETDFIYNNPSLVSISQRKNDCDSYESWADLKSRKQSEASRLKNILSNLGFQILDCKLSERISGREFWNLDTVSISDRNICPIPMFGSAAAGRYRVVCLWESPGENELLQLLADSNLARPTVILFFGRLTFINIFEISKISKKSRKSFLFIDENIFIYLISIQNTRLSAFFNITLPLTYVLPYDSTAGLVPPEMFYGRTIELDAVTGLNGRCFIYGGRQLGKTALLKRAEQSFHAPNLLRYSKWIDLRAEGIGVNRDLSQVWPCILNHLDQINIFDNKLTLSIINKKNISDLILINIKNFINSNPDNRILLLLDEADRFFEADSQKDFSETRKLKQLMDETSRRFKVVFAGLHNVLRMTERANHPLAHFGEPIKIGPLVGENEVLEAENLIRIPMLNSGFIFENRSLIIRILAQTNYYPSLIQLYCSHLLRHMINNLSNNDKSNNSRFVITDRDIEHVYSSGALREEIRSKFKLTLQLDPRYEVIAYTLARDVLLAKYEYRNGLDWQTIRESGAMYWWPDGFQSTSELDFRILLDEMVDLGVLLPLKNNSYSLRNPNVLLLLGNLDEIESVLIKNREPAIEFESGTFHPHVDDGISSTKRLPLTYQQLSDITRKNNSNNIYIIASNIASGLSLLSVSLSNYFRKEFNFFEISNCFDFSVFVKNLDTYISSKSDIHKILLISNEIPWTAKWVITANEKIKKIKNISLIFIADPNTLWNVLNDTSSNILNNIPVLTLLPWSDSFVRQWLEDQHLSNDIDLRINLKKVTGFWQHNLELFTNDIHESSLLNNKIINFKLSKSNLNITDYGIIHPLSLTILRSISEWGAPIDSAELSLINDISIDEVNLIMRWADLLGLVKREGGNYWIMDDWIKSILLS